MITASAPARFAASAKASTCGTDTPEQPTIHFFHHVIEIANPLRFAQKEEITDHHRPDDAVLPRVTAEVCRCPKILRMDLEIIAIGCG